MTASENAPTDAPIEAPMDADSWYRAARFIAVGSSKMCVVERGAGEPLLLIHGFPTASIDWQPISDALSKHTRLIAPDLLGFGRSDKPRQRYSIMLQADAVSALLRQLGLDQVHVLAHDYGDTVAQELLARHQGGEADAIQLRSLCFLNGGLFPECHRPRLIQRLLASPLGPLLARLYSKRKFSAAMHEIFGPERKPLVAEIDIFWQLLEHNNGRAVLPRLISYMAERRKYRGRWVGAMQRASIPLQLINGSADPISGAHMVARYRDLIAVDHINELAGIGHYPQVEAPEQVVRAYLGFRANC